MRLSRQYILFVVCLVVAVPLFSQEGHPLSGTWHGDWGTTARQRTDITLVIEWDGKNINGLINPGPESIKVSKATLDPSNWTVHFEGDAKAEDGKPVHFVADGKIQNLTAIRRSIVGVWVQGGVKADFKITRDQ